MILLAILLTLSAAEPKPVDCTEVRARVKEYGVRVSYLWALAQGYSPKEISRIRKQCGV